MSYRNSYEGIDSKIIKMVKTAAERSVGKAGIRKEDVPDIEQELMVFVLKGMGNYNEEKGGRPGYVKMLIVSKIRQIIRSRVRPSSSTLFAQVSLNMELMVDGEIFELVEFVNDSGMLEEMYTRPEPAAIDALIKRLDVETLIKRMPPGLQKICKKLMSGKIPDRPALGLSIRMLCRRNKHAGKVLKEYEF